MKKYILVGLILASLLACLIESMIRGYEKSLRKVSISPQTIS